MLATRGDHVPTGTEWVHEVKWDGIRALVEVADGAVRVWSRSGRDLSVAFPELAELARGPRRPGARRRDRGARRRRGADVRRPRRPDPHHRRAARRAGWPRANPVTLLAFDVLRLDGRDLDRAPVERAPRRCWRRSAWTTSRGRCPRRTTTGRRCWPPPSAGARGHRVQAGDLAATSGERAAATGSSSRSGRPGRSWSAATGTRPTATTGSVRCWSAQPTSHGLVYRGRVGSGIAGKAGRRARRRCSPRWCATTTRSSTCPGSTRSGTVWVRAGGGGRRAVPPGHHRRPAPAAGVPRRPHRPRPLTTCEDGLMADTRSTSRSTAAP